MLDPNRLISLFRKYGFEYKKNQSNNRYYAFTFKTGFFHNAEFIYTSDENDEEMNRSIKDLEKMGFSTKKSLFTSIENIEENLFKGFFNVDDWKKRIQEDYNIYCSKMLSILPDGAANYEYVKVPYKKENENRKNEEDIITDILSEIKEDSSKLILIEAPAGFGKTCTSYEILNELVNTEISDMPLPFFTEFSRDRQAKIFGHVFVREVDRSFRNVKSDLVIDETKNGKIILVLDGFDELLNDSSSNLTSDIGFEKTQPMLETIGELLTNSAKVILTSRRTAIFDGQNFQDWKDKYKSNFNVIRYNLNLPEIKDWLSVNRIEQLKKSNIDIQKLSNPVLLAYLRSVNDDTFDYLCNKGSRIVEHYFNSMLERERERQDLIMKPEVQTNILSSIALDMCENDYTSDEKEKIVDLIKDNSLQILEETRLLYTGKDRPTVDALANKLATHAFFDRSNQGENKIEFVNEFVFGNFIANGVINNIKDDWIAADERFVEPAVQSYLPRNNEDRELLWNKLKGMREFLSTTDHMKYEYLLKQHVDLDCYSNTTITNLSFDNASFFENSIIESSVFNHCIFKECSFNFKNFKDITFISCQFYYCQYDKQNSPYDISFLVCTDNNNLISDIEEFEIIKLSNDEESHLEKEILGKFMPLGSISITRLHIFTSLLYKIDGYSRKNITKAIKHLKEKGILETANNSSFTAINKTKVTEVKRILGRESGQ